MSLTKLFNYKYFFQNIKKSASTLALFIGVIPLLNIIIFLLMANANQNGFLATLDNLSILLLIGMYIIPVILAYSLYSFMFKKKSIDFIGSMPISKKSIYLTNTIGGSLLIFVMLFLTILLVGVTSLLFPHVYLTAPLLLDLFVIFLVGYLFVYATVTLAFSVSGNFITGLAVTMLLLFLVPYFRVYKESIVHGGYSTNDAYIDCNSEECIPEVYTCSEYDITCLDRMKRGEYEFYLYETSMIHTYIFPATPIFRSFGLESTYSFIEFNPKQLGVTSLFTVLYFLIGYFLYKRRKLENCETSFINFYVHLFVKGLTMFPICTIFYEMMMDQSIYVTLFVIALLLIYYFVYDLITRRHIEQIGKSLVAFIGIVSFFFCLCSFIHSLPREYTISFKSEDISKIEIKDYVRSPYSVEIYEVKGRTKINQILKYLVQDDSEHTQTVEIEFFVGGDGYRTNILLTEEQYENLFSALSLSKREELEDVDDAYALTIYGDFVNQDLKWYKKEVKEFLKKKESVSTTCILDTNLVFYRYRNHEVEEVRFSSCMSDAMVKKIMEDSNKRTLQFYKENTGHLPYISLMEEEENSEVMNFIRNYYSSELQDFVYKHLEETIELEEDILIFDLGYYDGRHYRAYINAKEEYDALIASLREKVEALEEYKEYKGMQEESVRGEDVEEYD